MWNYIIYMNHYKYIQVEIVIKCQQMSKNNLFFSLAIPTLVSHSHTLISFKTWCAHMNFYPLNPLKHACKFELF